jgi:hypothetical protein
MDPNPPYQRPPPPKDVEPPRQRIDVACSRCRRRKIRCSGYTDEQPRCMGCIKADHPCEFVNRVAPIIVPSNAPHSAPGTAIASPGYTRPWSPNSGGSPRGYGNMSAGHRRSTQGYHPYAQSQPSPTGMGYSPSPGYVVAPPWMQPQPQPQSPQDIAESYAGTGFHHLLDPTTSVQPRRLTTDGGSESPTMMMQSSLAQRRLVQREGSYTYGMETQMTSPLPSPLTIPSGIPSSTKGAYISSPGLGSREETGYGKLMYTPLSVSSSTPQLQSPMSASSIHATQIQNQSTQHINQKPANFSPISSTSQHSQSSQSFPTPSPQSQTPQFQEQQQQQPRMQTQQFQDQQPRMQYQDPQQRMQYPDQSRIHYQDPQQRQQQYPQDPNRPQYSPEFAMPSAPRRPNIPDVSTQSSASVITYSATQSHQSTQPSSIEYPGPTPLSQEYSYPRSTDRYPSPYKLVESQPRVLSRPASRSDQATSLTPQTLADHSHVQESIHEQHIDAAKNVLAVENGNHVQVIEYLDTIPQAQPTVPSQGD